MNKTVEINEEKIREEIREIVKNEMANQGILRFIRDITSQVVSKQVKRILKNGNKL